MKIVIFLCVLLISTSAYALENTKINRESQGRRYLATINIEEMMQGIFSAVPGGDKEDVDQFLKNIDMGAFTKVFHDAMVTTMTADELKLYADFYGSSLARSAIAKMPVMMKKVMEDIGPIIELAERKTRQNNK